MADKQKQKNPGLSKEIFRYIIFGVLTTVVSLISNFGILWSGKAVFHITDTESGAYFALYTVAKLISWICAVLFAFFTNKKWVFCDDVSDKVGILRQLGIFAGGRVATLGLDYVLNYGLLWLVSALPLSFLDGLFGVSLTTYNELIAWIITQVAVVIANYFISKIFVFRKSKKTKDNDAESDS